MTHHSKLAPLALVGGTLLLGCGSGTTQDDSKDAGVKDAGMDAAGPGPCGPLEATPFDAGTPGTFAGKAGAPCKRDIDCADGTFCYVVEEQCAPSSIIQGPGKGGHAANGGACVPAPAFPATCDALALDWSSPIEVSQSSASLGESDTTLVADGKGDVLIAWAANAAPLRQTNGLTRSTDGGKSFTKVTAPVHAAAEEENDAALAVDRSGLYYYVWEGYGASFQGAQHVYVSTSAAGLAWSPALQVDTMGDSANGTIPLDFPSVAINPVNDQPYFTYQVTTSSGPVPIRLVVGAKGGASVSPSVELDDGTRTASYRDLAKGAFDAKGSFYAAWVELSGSGGSTGQGLESGDAGNAIYFTRVDLGSGNALAPLGHDVLVSGKGETVVFGLPELHVTPDGADAYVIYEVGTKNAIDVRVAASHDRGLTWGPSVKVNDDATCATHYRAASALDAKGRLWVLWYDNRDGAGHVVYSVTDDGGRTFHPNRLVTQFAFPFETFQYSVGWLGDYFQVATTSTEILAAWSDPHVGDQSHVNFARATLPP